MAMTSSMMQSATLAARLALESAPGRGISRSAAGIVIGQAYPPPPPHSLPLTCMFAKRVDRKAGPGHPGVIMLKT